jgi:type VI secretion system protein ImpF
MARIDDALPPPAVSVLDRLLAGEDASAVETRSYRKAIAALRSSVLRDLEALLNARIGADPRARNPFEGNSNVEGELLRFGLPDLTLIDLRNERKRDGLRLLIADAVQRFEPRLVDVRVTVRGTGEHKGSTRFLIEARLRIDPEPIEFPFEATVQWADRAVEIQGWKQ